MMDEDRTMQLFGYTSDELSQSSKKKVVAVCDECGRYRAVRKDACEGLCRSCHGKSHNSTWTARIEYLLNHVWSGA